MWLENHTFVIHLHEIYCTPVVGKSYLNSSIYVRYIVPLRLENHTLIHPFMWDKLYLCGWKIIIPLSSIYMRYIVLSEYEIHPLTISYSFLKWMNPSNEFHKHLVCFPPLSISYSSLKWLNLPTEFHKHLIHFHTPPIHPFRMNFII